MADKEHLLVERRDDGVVLLTLNRPEQLNALSGSMMDRLKDVLRELELGNDVGCIVVTGAGRGFCSGGDVIGMAGAMSPEGEERPPGSEADAYESHVAAMHRTHQDLVMVFYELKIPTIALVNGPAAGAGMGLAAGADMRIASDRAFFTTAFARIGRSGDFGSTFLIRQIVGPAHARELYFTSRRLPADEALAMGFVNEVVPHNELMTRGLALASEIAAGPTRAYARMKRVFMAADAHDFRRVLDLETMFMPLSGQSSEGREFLKRFLDSSKK